MSALALPPAGQVWKVYYYADGQRVAMRELTASSDTLYFLLGDHLGSTAITASSSGGLSAELRYKPWGENRYTSGTTPTTYRFTGQRSEESGLGSLYDYGARFYSPALGRFLSADTIVPEPTNPQAWNRYSYVVNNPLKYTDPTGHCFIFAGLDTLFCAVAWFAIGSAAAYYAVMPPPTLPTVSLPVKTIDRSAIIHRFADRVQWERYPESKSDKTGPTIYTDRWRDRNDEEPDIVYRVPRPDEHPDALTAGFTAKDPSRRVHPQRHVTHGNVETDNWISTTRDPNWARKHQGSEPIYMIDLNKVNSTIVDTTVPGAMAGWHPIARDLARRASEVLVDTFIPPEAITGTIPHPSPRRR